MEKVEQHTKQSEANHAHTAIPPHSRLILEAATNGQGPVEVSCNDAPYHLLRSRWYCDVTPSLRICVGVVWSLLERDRDRFRRSCL